jgi:hypothetical protein
MKPSALLRPFAAFTLVAGCAAALAQSPTASSRFDAARDRYAIGHFGAAFAEFAELADQGHCDAARIAQQMVRYGKPLYAAEFSVARERLERWQRLPGCPLAIAAR